MTTATHLDEYLDEIRSQVCANCVERPPGGPPCEPLGKMCGVERHLPDLIEAIHDVHSVSIVPYWDSNQRQICDHCSFRHSSMCPCPMDYLLVLIVEAVETVDARHARIAKTRQRLAGVSSFGGEAVREIRELYEEASGTWTGCDWPTKFGKSELNLNGWTAADARMKAAAARGTGQEANWRAAADWLANVEKYAALAEDEGARAVHDAAAGDWREAFEHARQAWINEYATGRMIWRGFPMTWQPLMLAVEAAAEHTSTNAIQPAAVGGNGRRGIGGASHEA